MEKFESHPGCTRRDCKGSDFPEMCKLQINFGY